MKKLIKYYEIKSQIYFKLFINYKLYLKKS